MCNSSFCGAGVSKGLEMRRSCIFISTPCIDRRLGDIGLSVQYFSMYLQQYRALNSFRLGQHPFPALWIILHFDTKIHNAQAYGDLMVYMVAT